MNRQTRNWISAILAVSLLFILAAVLGALSGQRNTDPFQKRPSTFFTDESGARAFLLVLKRLLPSVEQWRRPLDMLPPSGDPSSASSLIVAGPSVAISKSEAGRLDQWLSEGGQLILATVDGWPLRRSVSRDGEGEHGPDRAPTQGKEEAVKKETYLSRHAPGIRWSKAGDVRNEQMSGPLVTTGELRARWKQQFSSTEGSKVVASAGTAALAVEIPVGRGRIVAIADPTMVSNQALREADHAVWLVSLAAGWGNGKVIVDEFHHGFGKKRSASALSWAFLKTPWGWCLAQALGVGLLYVFGYRRRFGRISEPPPPARASALELAAARAGLFQAAGAQGLAVELISQHLCQELGRAYGKPVDLSTLQRKLEADKTGTAATLVARLAVLSSKVGRDGRLTEQEFIEVGRTAGQILQGAPL